MSREALEATPGSDGWSGNKTWGWRKLKDRTVRHLVQIGGISVIIAILLIFLFLLSVVWPLFESSSAREETSYTVPAVELGNTLYLSVEEQNEVGIRLTDQAQIIFFDTHTGKVRETHQVSLPDDTFISDFSLINESEGLVALGLNTGGFIVMAHKYSPDFSGERRVMIPRVEYPLGTDPIVLDEQGRGIRRLHVGANEDGMSAIAQLQDGEVIYRHWEKHRSLLGNKVRLEAEDAYTLSIPVDVFEVLVGQTQEWAYVLSTEGTVFAFALNEGEAPLLNEAIQTLEDGRTPSYFSFLNGDISILIGDSQGGLSQWFHSRNPENEAEYLLQKIRTFQMGHSAITSISAEQLRKGILTADESGYVQLIYTTSEREMLDAHVSDSAVVKTAISPRSEQFLALDANDKIHVWDIKSNYPEASIKSIWGKIWYEDYSEPEFIWQSSSASSDFEPKFSLVPLTFGTLKAAFYAMLFAMPLAICGAIFTAYFMAPKMRGIVKPSIEIMEALPTVILGFLAGLWLAPFVEKHLPGVFSVFVFTPFVLVLCAYIWWRLPKRITGSIPEGWQAALLIPPTIITIWLLMYLSPYIETWLFDGNIRLWMQQSFGIDYDQRNAIIIGIAMGFAVIPTIFSIAEDAIFSVPKHLTSGSLALGATYWQTLVRVVLLSASPGIFSAVMIGFGRAVGETMIVLMATGNTPVMDLSIFQGMRTLSANVAVELPESEVGSTHYRVLFLAALVLFLFTFAFNTIAEIVRQRLRNKYSNL